MAIERTVRSRPVRNALDIGTGSGVLAIAIAKLAHIPVLASDIDPVATRVAAANVRLNEVHPEVRVVTAAGISGRVFRQRGPYDLIVANILAGPADRTRTIGSPAARAGGYRDPFGLGGTPAEPGRRCLPGGGTPVRAGGAARGMDDPDAHSAACRPSTGAGGMFWLSRNRLPGS